MSFYNKSFLSILTAVLPLTNHTICVQTDKLFGVVGWVVGGGGGGGGGVELQFFFYFLYVE